MEFKKSFCQELTYKTIYSYKDISKAFLVFLIGCRKDNIIMSGNVWACKISVFTKPTMRVLPDII